MNYRIIICIFLGLLKSHYCNGQSHYQDISHQLPATSIGGNTMDIGVADFNGDGYLDIVLAKEWQRNRLLFNDGNGNFLDVSDDNLSDFNYDSEDVAIADYDGNGWLDIVFASEDNGVHEMYLNLGYGKFEDVSGRLPNFISNAVVSYDVNADGYPDLIFGNAGQNLIFINDGEGYFTDETTKRIPTDNDVTQDILLVDINNDGAIDLAMGNEGNSKLYVNDGKGFFKDESINRLPHGINIETRKISKSDINGDGFDDLFFCNMASAYGRDIRDRLYLNDGKGVFSDVTGIQIPFVNKHSFEAIFTDLNNDDKPDLIVGYIQNFKPDVFINDGKGNFIQKTEDYFFGTIHGNTIAIISADFDKDEKQELYLGAFQVNDRLLRSSFN